MFLYDKMGHFPKDFAKNSKQTALYSKHSANSSIMLTKRRIILPWSIPLLMVHSYGCMGLELLGSLSVWLMQWWSSSLTTNAHSKSIWILNQENKSIRLITLHLNSIDFQHFDVTSEQSFWSYLDQEFRLANAKLPILIKDSSSCNLSLTNV